MFLHKAVGNLSTIRGGARNISDGSKCASLRYFSKTVEAMHDGVEYGSDLYAMVEVMLTDPSKTLVLYSEMYYILKHGTSADVDAIAINNGQIHLYNFNNRSNENSFNVPFDPKHFSDNVSAADGILGFVQSLQGTYTEGRGYSTRLKDAECEHIQVFIIDNKTGDLITSHSCEDEDTFNNHEFANEFTFEKRLPKATQPVNVAEVSKPNQTTEKGNKMTKVAAIVTANKSAAQTAVKIEAGNIALDKIVALVAPKMPFGTSSYLKSPIGKVVVANLISFGVSQYAANNPKAQIIADAVMEAAALQLVQSFNVAALIDDLVGSVNLSGLEPAEGLAKYAVDKSAE